MARTKMAGLVVALVLGAASVSQAQQPAQGQGRSEQGQRQEGRGQRDRMQARGRGMEQLFKGIDLTDQQKEQLKQLREQNRPKFEGRGQRAGGERAERQRPTEEQREQFRAQMQERQEKLLKEMRALLTPEQQQIFDKNAAEAKERFQKRGDR